MFKRIAIYISCALLIFVSVHVWGQQIDRPVEVLFQTGPDMALTLSVDQIDFGVLSWPADGSSVGTLQLDLDCNAGIGAATVRIAIASILTDLNGLSPDQGVQNTYFRLGMQDDAGNVPADLFNPDGFVFLDPAMPFETVVFSGVQGCEWNITYYQLLAVQGSWQTYITFTITAQ